MCAFFKKKDKLFKPGKKIIASGKSGAIRKVWAGFARSEILDWWQNKKAAVLLDIPATHFAERSDLTGKLLWADVCDGLVIRGVLETKAGNSVIRVVTRAADAEELKQFGHPRMPVLEAPLFAPLPDHLFEEEEEPDLFGLPSTLG